MEMFNPPHPGGLLKEAIPELGLTVTQAAREIGVNRVTLSRVINGQSSISAEMALKLEDLYKAYGYKGGKAEHWLRMQIAYDLWQARHNKAA